MNKQRYLAELQRLLVFMTEDDRAAAVRHYADMFDAAGEAGADALVAEIGSPTKAAIALSRGYEPGSYEPDAAIPAGPAPRRHGSAPAAPELWADLPELDIPGFDVDDDALDTPGDDDEDDTADAALFTDDDADEDDETPRRDRPRRAPAPSDTEDEPWRRDRREKQPRRTIPLVLGIPLFILIAVAIGLPLTVLTVAAILLLLVPGIAGGVAAWLIAVGALWCVAFMADAILMFGLAFVALAVAIIVLWAGIWLDSKLLALWAQGVEWLCGELLGKRVTTDE